MDVSIAELEKCQKENNELKLLLEENNQKIYELKRSLDTAVAAERYATQELELMILSHSNEIKNNDNHNAVVLDSLRNEVCSLKNDISCLEKCVEELSAENDSCRQKIVELELKREKPNKPGSFTESDYQLLENENFQLHETVSEYQERMNKSLILLGERERKIELLEEHLRSTEANLSLKSEELDMKAQMIDNFQEKIDELNHEISELKLKPEHQSHQKGNSLFAEVDDQRQAMKALLLTHKNNLFKVKKLYSDSQYEVGRLKRENAAMQKEIQICCHLFLSADKGYKEKLNKRIQQLMVENKELCKRLKDFESKTLELASSKGITWLDSMLLYCKNETMELAKELKSCRMEKAVVDEQFLNSQQQLAKWRLDALQSRCRIIMHETVFTKNNIKLPTSDSDFKISVKECACGGEKMKILLSNEPETTNLLPGDCHGEEKENGCPNKSIHSALASFSIESGNNTPKHGKNFSEEKANTIKREDQSAPTINESIELDLPSGLAQSEGDEHDAFTESQKACVLKPVYRSIEFSPGRLECLESDLALLKKLKMEKIDPGVVHRQGKLNVEFTVEANSSMGNNNNDHEVSKNSSDLLNQPSRSLINKDRNRSKVIVKRVILKK